MKKYLAAILVGLLGYVAPARADEVYMINDGQGVANFDSESNQPGGYDLSGFRAGSIEICGIGGTAFGTVTVYWRNTKNDSWLEVGTIADPGDGKFCKGIYGPGVGYVKAVLAYGGPGTFRVTLRRQ